MFIILIRWVLLAPFANFFSPRKLLFAPSDHGADNVSPERPLRLLRPQRTLLHRALPPLLQFPHPLPLPPRFPLRGPFPLHPSNPLRGPGIRLRDGTRAREQNGQFLAVGAGRDQRAGDGGETGHQCGAIGESE